MIHKQNYRKAFSSARTSRSWRHDEAGDRTKPISNGILQGSVAMVTPVAGAADVAGDLDDFHVFDVIILIGWLCDVTGALTMP